MAGGVMIRPTIYLTNTHSYSYPALFVVDCQMVAPNACLSLYACHHTYLAGRVFPWHPMEFPPIMAIHHLNF